MKQNHNSVNTSRKINGATRDFVYADPELLESLQERCENDFQRACAYIAFYLEGFKDNVKPNLDETALGVELRESGQYNLVNLFNRISCGIYRDIDDLKADYEKQVPVSNPDSGPVRATIARFQLETRKILESWEDRPTVRFDYNFPDVHLTLQEIEIHLGRGGIFNRGGSLVRVVESDHLKQRGTDNEIVPRPVIETLTPQAAAPLLTGAIRFLKTTTKETKRGIQTFETPAKPPKSLIEELLALGKYENTPIILGLQDGPFLRADGSVCNSFGYDPKSMFFLAGVCEGLEPLGDVLDCEAEGYAERLLSLAGEFPFRTNKDRAAWLAAVLTLAARPAIKGSVPAFVFAANNQGSGKTLLVNAAHVLAYGRETAVLTPPAGKDAVDEWRKTLFSLALAGSPVAFFDEIEMGSNVGNQATNAVITSRTISSRLLHSNVTKEIPWNTTLFFAGNSLGLGSDMARRAITSVLQTPFDDPAKRLCSFEIPDLIGYIKENRAELLTAVFSILKWNLANPADCGLPSFGSFEQWDRLVRTAVYRLTGEDVCVHDETIIDQRSSELQQLLAGLAGFQQYHAQNSPVLHWSATDLFQAVQENPTAAWAVTLGETFDSSLSVQKYATSVGMRLNKYKNRPCDGQAITPLRIDKKPRYQIVPI